MRSGLRRRPIRLVAAAAVVAVAASTAVALPTVSPQGKPAHLDRKSIQLSGKGAEPRRAPAARTASARSEAKAPPRTVTDGWSAEVDVPDETQLVDFTWTGSRDAEIQIRYRQDDGGWSEWTHLHSEPDEGPDSGGNGRQGIPPVWLGSNGTEDVQVKVVEGDLTDLQAASSHWTPATGGATAGAEPAGPGIHGRNEWAPGGWRSDIGDCGSGPTVMNQLKHAVIHHTVNANNYAAGNVPGMLAAIYRYHTDGQGWCDIAYNFVVDRFGRVWQGRSGDINTPVMGGHAKGFNTDSVGVALLGQYEPGASPAAARPSTAEINAVKSLVAWKLGIHGLSPTASTTVTTAGSTKYPAGTRVTIPVINGHQDTSLTGCPGDYVYSLISSIRRDASSQIQAAATPRTWSPFTTGQTFFRKLQVDALNTSTETNAALMTSLVVRDRRTRARVANDLILSKKGNDRMGIVLWSYFAFTGTWPPQTREFRDWVAARDSGLGYPAMADRFAAKYAAGLSDANYIRMAYRNVLHNPNATAERIAHWSAYLRAGHSRGQMMVEFMKNPDFRKRVNRPRVLSMIYFTLLRRLPDTGARSTWTTFWNNGATTIDTVGVVLGSAEYANRF